MSTRFQRKLECKETILDRVLDWFSEKYTDFIIVPHQTIKRFCYWGWKLRYNYDWDCASLTYYILYLKLKGLIDYSRKHAHLCWNSKEDGKEFRKLKIACKLAKRLSEHDYNTHMNAHDEKWGELNFHLENRMGCFTRIKAITERAKEQENKEFLIADAEDTQQRENEKEYLFKIIKKHMDGWWD